MKTIIFLSGHSGAGKSVISKSLAQRFNGKYFNCSDILTNYAKGNGYDHGRYMLKESGVDSILKQIEPLLLRDIRANTNKSQILFADSLYYYDAYKELKKDDSLRIFLVAIDADHDFRLVNFKKREGEGTYASEEYLDLIDDYKNQTGLIQLFESADMKYSNGFSTNLIELIDKIESDIKDKLKVS